MASQHPPKRGVAFVYSVSLVSQADTKLFKTTATLATGDVTVSKDGAGFDNVGTLPVEIAATGVLVGTLTATEMTADRVVLRFRDAAGAEWCDLLLVLDTAAANFDDLNTDVDAILADTGTDGVVVKAAGLAADAVTEIQAGLATAAALDTVDNFLDTEITAIIAAVDAVPTAAEIWANATRTLTQTAAAVTAAVSGSTLAMVRGVTFTGTLSGLTISASWTKMFLTVKEHLADADTAAIAQVVVSNPGVGTDGLRYLNGASGTAAWASLTVNQAAGTIAITIDDDATALLPTGSYAYDIKELVGSVSVLLTSGLVTVSATPTQALS